jgi:hypothetical protein
MITFAPAPVTATGDVAGPASSVDNRLATFSGITGKLLKDASGITALAGAVAGVVSITGTTGNMTITAGTGNSRTLALQSTTAGGVATTFLTGDASQNTTLAGNLTLGAGASQITGAAGNMTILAGTGNSRTLTFQTTTSGGVATNSLVITDLQRLQSTANGLVGSPAFSFVSAPTSGMYWTGGGVSLAWAVGGALCLSLDSTALSLGTGIRGTGGNGSAANPTWDVNGRGGMYSAAANTISFAAAGTGRATVDANGLHPFANGTGTLGLTAQRWGGAFFSGPVIKSTQPLSGAGAANVTTDITKITTTGAGDAITLADGVDGQVKTIIHDVDGGSFVLTPTTRNGWSSFTSTAAGESITLMFVTTRGWTVIANYLGVIAP